MHKECSKVPSGTWYDYLNNNTAQTEEHLSHYKSGELKIYISTAVAAQQF